MARIIAAGPFFPCGTGLRKISANGGSAAISSDSPRLRNDGAEQHDGARHGQRRKLSRATDTDKPCP